MIKKLKIFAASLVVMMGLVGLTAMPASAALCSGSAKSCIGGGVNEVDSGANGNTLSDLIKNVINILLFIVGVAAVVMIIIGGLRYTTSGGDSSSVTAAKNTILYSIVGLVVASLAFAIVNFVVDKL